jgi:hypothetical protein
MPLVDAAVAEFTGVLAQRAGDVAPIIGQTRASTLGFGSSPDPEQDTQMVDLAMLASQIGVAAPDVSAQADALVNAIDAAVLDSVAGSGMPGATGLSIYFPPFAELFNAEYSDVESTKAWAAFLTSFYEIGQNIPEAEQPQFLEETDGTQVFFDEDGVNIAGTFDIAAQDNLAEATINYGIVGEDGSVSFIGDEPAQIAEDGSGLALGIYDLTTLTITDGQDTAYAYLSLSVDQEAGVATIDVPLFYQPPDSDGQDPQDVLLSLTVDSATGDVLNETYYLFDAETGTYGELTADPNGLIVPQVLYVSADGEEAEWLPTSDVGLFADLPLLQYSFEPLPSGTPLYIELTVTDFGGNSDSVFAEVEVP